MQLYKYVLVLVTWWIILVLLQTALTHSNSCNKMGQANCNWSYNNFFGQMGCRVEFVCFLDKPFGPPFPQGRTLQINKLKMILPKKRENCLLLSLRPTLLVPFVSNLMFFILLQGLECKLWHYFLSRKCTKWLVLCCKSP